MSEEQSEIERLLQAHAELQFGLRSCHELVADLRSKLAANGNEPASNNDGSSESKDQSAG